MRRRRSLASRPGRGLALALGVAGALSGVLSAPASAQVIEGEPDQYRSPQHFALEIRLGPYKPDIDSEFNRSDRTPYRDFFGPGRRLMSQVELDYQFVHHVGSAALGLSAGYFHESANNLPTTGSDQRTADSSTLRLIPLSLSAVYRFDLAYERYKIPLVPYGKLGFDYVLWTVNNGNGEIPSDATGGNGSGGTFGWHAAVGVSLVLDFFDPVSAAQFDNEIGVNHTHLFFEYGHWDVSGLGSSHRLHVGDNTWAAGIMFEF
jgi:hypothetical protein